MAPRALPYQHGLNEIRARVNNHTHGYMLDVFTHLYIEYKGVLNKSPMKLGPWWLIASTALLRFNSLPIYLPFTCGCGNILLSGSYLRELLICLSTLCYHLWPISVLQGVHFLQQFCVSVFYNMQLMVFPRGHDIKNNAWVTVNNDFRVTSEAICQ